MTFEKLWAGLEARNPRLKDPVAKVVITAAMFKKALRQAYDHGDDEAQERYDLVSAFMGNLK